MKLAHFVKQSSTLSYFLLSHLHKSTRTKLWFGDLTINLEIIKKPPNKNVSIFKHIIIIRLSTCTKTKIVGQIKAIGNVIRGRGLMLLTDVRTRDFSPPPSSHCQHFFPGMVLRFSYSSAPCSGSWCERKMIVTVQCSFFQNRFETLGLGFPYWWNWSGLWVNKIHKRFLWGRNTDKTPNGRITVLQSIESEATVKYCLLHVFSI